MYLQLLLFLVSIFLFETKITYAKTSFSFASLKSSEVNMRVGPGREYPIIWIFMKSNLPMILLAEFGEWKKLKFMDGTEGWVHKNMVSKASMAIVAEDNVLLYKYSSSSNPIAHVEKNVIAKILKNESEWVKVEICNMTGWMKKKCLWGINDE